jgi:hypothetical protein
MRRAGRTLTFEVPSTRKVLTAGLAHRGGSAVCYNCGCGMSDNDMGNPKNITEKTFQEAANAAGQSLEEAKQNTLELLERAIREKR